MGDAMLPVCANLGDCKRAAAGDRLLETPHLAQHAAMDKLFISADSLLRDSMELARLIIASGFRPTFLVAMWRGGAPIGIAVQEVLEFHGIHTDHIAIRTSSYTGIDNQSKTVRVHAVDYLVSRLSAEDELLLVDDVFDSGRSLEAVIAELKRRCKRNFPDKVRIATVYYKSSRNRSAITPDYYVLDTDKWLVFPHEISGLTREEILAHKPVGEDFFEPP
jgi:hypoxanthine phosphoribosyltransferase